MKTELAEVLRKARDKAYREYSIAQSSVGEKATAAIIAAAEKWLLQHHISDDTLTALADIEELTPPDVPLGEHLRRCVAAWDRECERASSLGHDVDWWRERAERAEAELAARKRESSNRTGEMQYAAIQRNRSGMDAGSIDMVVRVQEIEQLVDADQHDAAAAALMMAESVLENCSESSRAGLQHLYDRLGKLVPQAVGPPADADAIMAEAREAVACKCEMRGWGGVAASLRGNDDDSRSAWAVNVAAASVMKHVTTARAERDDWKAQTALAESCREEAEAELAAAKEQLAALKADDSWKAGLRRIGESLKNMQPMTEEDWTLVKEYRDRVDSLKKERDELRQQLAAKPAREKSEAKMSPWAALRLLHAADNDVESIEREAQNVSWFLRTLIDWPDSLPRRYFIAKPLAVGEKVVYCGEPCIIRAIYNEVAWIEPCDGSMFTVRLVSLRRPNEDGESVEPIEEADDE